MAIMAIMAELPRGDGQEIKEIRDLVQRYQIHNCRPNRCFRTSKGNASNKCKYGFPFGIRHSDGYDESGQRYEYKRREKEDSLVVSYNPYLLLAWDGHVNVQKITNTGLERYLVKYISKVEPTFNLQIEHSSQVRQYLESRIIGAPEAAAIQLSFHMVESNMAVVFLDTNFPNERARRLKPLQDLKEADANSEEVFMPRAREHY